MIGTSKTRMEIARYAVLSFAALIMAVNYRTFADWGGLYPGGAAGLALLIQRLGQAIADAAGWKATVPFGPINLLVNAIPVWIGFRYLGLLYFYKVVLFAQNDDNIAKE